MPKWHEAPLSKEGQKAQQLLNEKGFSIQIKEHGKKFRKFLGEVAGLSKQEAAFLYVLRCSLVHSYSLNVSDKKMRNNGVTNAPPAGNLLTVDESATPARYILHLWELKRVFLKTVGKFKQLVERAAADSEIRKYFSEQVQSSGYISTESK